MVTTKEKQLQALKEVRKIINHYNLEEIIPEHNWIQIDNALRSLYDEINEAVFKDDLAREKVERERKAERSIKIGEMINE